MPALRKPRENPGQPVGVRLLRRFRQHFLAPALGEGQADGAAHPTVKVTVTVTDSSAEETPHRFSQAELEDMVRRWDFDENKWVCRDLLIVAFPQAASRWSQEELAQMHTMDLLVETARRDPWTALDMTKLLLNTAEEHLQNEEAADQLLEPV